MSELDPSFQNSSPTKTPKNSLDEEIDEDEESILDDQSIDDVGTIEENCDDNDDPFDWELEVPIDVSIDSDSSQDDSDVSEFEIQEEAEEEVREDVFDKIIDAFTVKRRKAIIDLDQDSDLVDYEESQKRLFILATIFATILGIIATIKSTNSATTKLESQIDNLPTIIKTKREYANPSSHYSLLLEW